MLKRIHFSLRLQAATSFDCDGCNHHASFHSLENPAEDAVLQRWAEQESASAQAPQAISGTNKKRKMITQTAVNCNDDAAILRASSATGNRGSARRKAPMPKNKAESRISTAKSDGIEDSERKLYEIVDGEMVLQEWD